MCLQNRGKNFEIGKKSVGVPPLPRPHQLFLGLARLQGWHIELHTSDKSMGWQRSGEQLFLGLARLQGWQRSGEQLFLGLARLQGWQRSGG